MDSARVYGTLPQRKDTGVDGCAKIPADLNCDGYVDIIDFSIMYYWFERTNIPTRVDLRQDGRVDLADFSVMAAYWYERPRY